MDMVTAEVRTDTEVDTAVAIIAEDMEATGLIRCTGKQIQNTGFPVATKK